MEQHGYHVEYLDMLWNSIDAPTVYPECYMYNLNKYFKKEPPACGGAWRVVLRNPKAVSENMPFIYCTFFDLKVEATAHQAELENIWFSFANEVYKDIHTFKNVDDANFLKKSNRDFLIRLSTLAYQKCMQDRTNYKVLPVGIAKPVSYNPEKSYSAQIRAKRILQESTQSM